MVFFLYITQDYILNGAIQIKQMVNSYRVSIDAILLAASVSIHSYQHSKILDVGAGVGSVSLCIARRLHNAKITGIEIQQELYTLFHQNIIANNLQNQITPLHGDIISDKNKFTLLYDTFDQVISNPPYYINGSLSKNHSKVQAQQQNNNQFKEWIEFCLKMVRNKGRITFIYPAHYLDRLIAILYNRTGDMHIYPIWSRKNSQKPSRVILSVRKGVHSPMVIRRGLIIHNNCGRYLTTTDAILRNPLPLPDF